jgi:hypothetical protein
MSGGGVLPVWDWQKHLRTLILDKFGVKFFLVRASKAHKVSRGMASLILNLVTR